MGLETGTVPASDVDNPKKNIPRAILIGTSVAAFIYIIGTITIMGVIPRAQLLISKAPYSDLAAHLFGGSWSIPFAVLATVSCIGTLNGWTMVVSRIASGAASDGLFPKFLKKETKSGAPLWGTIISSVCMIPIIALTLSEHLIEQFQFIIELATNVILFIYLACVFSYIIINKKNKTLSIFRIILSIIGLGFCIWTLCVSDMATHLCSLVVFLSGIPFFLWQRKTNMYKKRM
jgi:APA family basic amino acid/polyamine antiporter